MERGASFKISGKEGCFCSNSLKIEIARGGGFGTLPLAICTTEETEVAIQDPCPGLCVVC
jgi:hypothetical protein